MRIIEKTLTHDGFTGKMVYYLSSEAHITQGHPQRLHPRPFVIIVPGGGYHMVCEREAEPMAMAFLNRGFNCAVLYYSVDTAKFPTALVQLAKAMADARENAEEYNIDPERISLFGASAGGHLAASLGVFWNRGFLKEHTGLEPSLIKPNSMVLAYPVITSGEKAHRNSFNYLLGNRAEDAEMLELLSLEKQISHDVPPAFIWTTREDAFVPVENSLMFAAALQRGGVKYELHIYPTGEHGSGLCTPETIMVGDISEYAHMAGWFDNAVRFLNTL